MDLDKGWGELNVSWEMSGVKCWIVLALNGYATKDYPNISTLVICYEWYAAWFGFCV